MRPAIFSPLFAFEVRADLHESRVFYMDHIMIPNSGPRDALASTVGAAERLAEENNGCRAIWPSSEVARDARTRTF